MERAITGLPPLSRLRPFEAAARLESFSKAAAELGLTQTAVSKQIGQLEQDLGTALFERRNRAVFLTDAGRRLGRVVSAALSDIATEINVLRGAREGGELVLHCQLCEAFYWLMPRLSRFHARHPDIELRIVSSERPVTEAVDIFDVAIQTSGRPSGTHRLMFTASDEIFPVCAPGLVSSQRLPLQAEDLVQLPLLSHQVLPQDWMDWPGWFALVGARVPAGLQSRPFDSYPLAVQAAVAGQGVALGWRRTTEAMLADGTLIQPCAQRVVRPADLSIFKSAGRQVHADAGKLLSWLEEELTDAA